MKSYKKFDILVEKMSKKDAEKLLDTVIDFCEERGLKIGGGFETVTEKEILKESEEE